LVSKRSDSTDHIAWSTSFHMRLAIGPYNEALINGGAGMDFLKLLSARGLLPIEAKQQIHTRSMRVGEELPPTSSPLPGRLKAILQGSANESGAIITESRSDNERANGLDLGA